MTGMTVIGLDGVNWKVLEKAIEQGLMPNLEKILEKGVKTELETTYPPVTGPAWTSIMTGCNPGRHGVFDFVDHVDEGRPYNSADISSETIYEKVAEEGKVTLVNLPLSYPPVYSGDFIGSFLAPENDFVYPESLKEEFDFSSYKKSLSALEKTFNVVECSLEAARDKRSLLDSLMEDQDLFFLLFSAPDWIMHERYHKMESGESDKEFEVFEIMDDAIGRAEELSNNIILLSDHGFKAFDHVFHVNQWLREEGYLKTEGSMESQWVDNTLINTAVSAVSRYSSVRKTARKLYLYLEDYLPFPENVNIRLRGLISEGIDMDKSVAFCPSSGIRGIYINDERFKGLVKDPGSMRREIIDSLPCYMNPIRREEVFDGEFVSEAPDILFREDYARISRGVYGKVLVEKPVNHHGRKGFFAAAGEQFQGDLTDDYNLYSVAPTIAELFDVEFDADADPIPIVSESIEIEEFSIDF